MIRLADLEPVPSRVVQERLQLLEPQENTLPLSFDGSLHRERPLDSPGSPILDESDRNLLLGYLGKRVNDPRTEFSSQMHKHEKVRAAMAELHLNGRTIARKEMKKGCVERRPLSPEKNEQETLHVRVTLASLISGSEDTLEDNQDFEEDTKRRPIVRGGGGRTLYVKKSLQMLNEY
eukprot:TRINITY_DN5907_c0_g1_i1.p2 TRINITY_DN5907_c0_g1~~TRINITY_DN5907_c0_g1_i1.p2  ORF type:complete len:177 (+),score=31.42 TRINITY_DN5907_c0_g1_i1:637-1167(+)